MIYLVRYRRPGEPWRQDAFSLPSKAQAVALFLECDGYEVERDMKDPGAAGIQRKRSHLIPISPTSPPGSNN